MTEKGNIPEKIDTSVALKLTEETKKIVNKTHESVGVQIDLSDIKKFQPSGHFMVLAFSFYKEQILRQLPSAQNFSQMIEGKKEVGKTIDFPTKKKHKKAA